MSEKKCQVENCGPADVIVRGFCGKHYQRWLKWGDVTYVAPNYGGQSGEIDKKTGLLVRAKDKIQVTETCWLWEGSVVSDGYGSIRHLGVWWSTHRYVYTTLVGTIPEGLELDHLCNVRNCVNPDHLEPVTGRENKRRVGARRKMCSRGLHERTEENIRRDGISTRCRPCHNEYQKEYYRKKREENR